MDAATFTEIPENLKERALKHKVTYPPPAPKDAQAKPRGMNGPHLAAVTVPNSINNPVDPQSQSSHSTNGWPGAYGSMAPFVLVHPSALNSQALPQVLSSPVRPKTRVEDGKLLSEWLPLLDAELEPGEEHYGGILNALNENGAYRVRDVTHFTANEIKEYTQCSIGLAKRLLEKAQMAMRMYRKGE